MTAVNVGSPFSAGSVATFMASSLPPEAEPQIKNPYDALALFGHACMTAIGFRLLGLGEDHRIGIAIPTFKIWDITNGVQKLVQKTAILTSFHRNGMHRAHTPFVTLTPNHRWSTY